MNMSDLLVRGKLKNTYFSYFLMFNFYYSGWALFSALISIYLIGLGFSAGQASWIVSISFLASMIFQPLIGSAADRYGMKRISTIAFCAAAATGLVFVFCRSFITIALFYAITMVLLNSTNPIVEKLATTSPFPYGKIRIWGTIGYALGTQAAGYLYDAISPSAIFIAFVVSILICIIGTLRIDVDPIEAEEIKEKDQMTGKEEKTGFRSLLANRKYVYYLVVYALFTGVTQATHTFVPSMFTYEGLPASAASTILSIAVLCELPLVFFSGKFMDRCTSKKLSLIAFSLAMIQLLIYGLSMPMAAKIGITLMAKHPAGMLVIMINLKIVSSLVSPKQQISALALAATVKNLASIVFNNLAGTMIDMEGYALTFLILAGILAVGMLLLVVFRLPKGTDQHLFS